MSKGPAETHKLDDRATEKVINHPKVRERIPSIAKVAKKTAKVIRRCTSCGRRRRNIRVKKKTDLNAVREHIANLPQKEKRQLLRVLGTKELVVPYVRTKDKRRVKLKIK